MVSKKLGYKSANIQDIKQFFIGKCNASNVSPLKFAAGLWFLGSRSLELAVECLSRIQIEAKG
mgnify:CR=1 FL=1